MIVFSNIWQVAGSCGTQAEAGPLFSVRESEQEGGGVQRKALGSVPARHGTTWRCLMRTPKEPPPACLLLPYAAVSLCGSSSLWDELEGERVIITHTGFFRPP